MKKQEVIEQIKNNNLGSIYSKEDVIRLMEQVEPEPVEIKINPKVARLITDKIITYLEDIEVTKLVDFDSAEFCISYRNELQLENIDSMISIDEEDIIKIIEESFEEDINNLES